MTIYLSMLNMLSYMTYFEGHTMPEQYSNLGRSLIFHTGIVLDGNYAMVLMLKRKNALQNAFVYLTN